MTSRVAADALEFCLWTGDRSGNVKAARWAEISIERATWTIPASTHKNKKPVTIALTPRAMSIIERRKEQSRGEWVFPGRRRGHPLVNLAKPWSRLIKAAGLQGVRIHDIRRTAGSWMAAGGASLPVIGKALGHASTAATQIYARLDLDPARAAITAAGAAIEAASQSKREGGNGKV